MLPQELEKYVKSKVETVTLVLPSEEIDTVLVSMREDGWTMKSYDTHGRDYRKIVFTRKESRK